MAEAVITVSVDDQASSKLNKMSGRMDELDGQTSSYSTSASKASTNTAMMGGAMGAAMSSLKGLAAAFAAGVVGKMFFDEMKAFDTAMTEVSTLLDNTEGEMDAMKGSVIELAGETAQAPSSLADALYEVVSAGNSGKEAMDILEVAAKAAVAGLTDTKTAVDGITSVLNAYGMEASDAKTVSDQMFTAIKEGKTTFPELADAIGKVLPVADSLKIEFGEVASAIATLTSKGMSTAEAATGLKSFLNAMINNAEAFTDAGVDIIEVLDERGISGAMDVLMGKTGGNVEAMKKFIPEVEGLTTALALTNDGGKKYNETMDEMKNSSGATAEAFDEVADSYEHSSDRIKAEFGALAASATETILPVLTSIYNSIANIISGLHSFAGAVEEGAKNWIGWLDAALEAIGEAIAAMDRGVESARSAVGEWLSGMVDAWQSGASTLVSEAVSLVSDIMSAIAEGVEGASSAVGEWLSGMVDAWQSGASTLVSEAASSGGEIADALADALSSAGNSIAAAIDAMFTAAYNAVLNWINKIKSAISSLKSYLSGSPVTGGAYHTGGLVMHEGGAVPRYHSGGALGPNEVPAILERGEFVMRKEAVSALGAGTLAALNRVMHDGGLVPRYHSGGTAQAGGGGGGTINATINVSGGSGSSVARDIDAALADLWRSNRSRLKQEMAS